MCFMNFPFLLGAKFSFENSVNEEISMFVLQIFENLKAKTPVFNDFLDFQSLAYPFPIKFS